MQNSSLYTTTTQTPTETTTQIDVTTTVTVIVPKETLKNGSVWDEYTQSNKSERVLMVRSGGVTKHSIDKVLFNLFLFMCRFVFNYY